MLTSNDSTVLTQLFDPEAAPSSSVLIDPSLPEDTGVPDVEALLRIRHAEKAIIRKVESALCGPPSRRIQGIEQARSELEELLELYPQAASLLNDYAQIIRLQYGDNILTDRNVDNRLAAKALDCLDRAILLLSPQTPQAAVSPVQSRTLAQAYTQRGALFHSASKALVSDPRLKVTVPSLRSCAGVDLAEAASRDFFMGGRYGNEVAKGLAVHTNPTAKLCGQMVKDAMRREFAPQLQEI